MDALQHGVLQWLAVAVVFVLGFGAGFRVGRHQGWVDHTDHVTELMRSAREAGKRALAEAAEAKERNEDRREDA